MTAPSVPRTSKTCSVCQETKPREAFPRWGKPCKVCKAAMARARDAHRLRLPLCLLWS
jgi:hypothetical protein